MNKKAFDLIIPAAGEATRLRPLTSNMSKVMVPVNGKPCLDWILDQASKLGVIRSCVIVTGKFNDVEEYVSRKSYSFDIHTVKQDELRGPRHAISLGYKKLFEEVPELLPSIVWLGDAILLEDELPIGQDFLVTTKVDDPVNWCVFDSQNNLFYDKRDLDLPNREYDALVGVYGFGDTWNAANAFARVSGYDISSALIEYLEYSKSPLEFSKIHTDQWYDIGDTPTYYNTCAELLSRKAREFNNFKFDPNTKVITKFANFDNKHALETLENEKEWYYNVPSQFKPFIPRIFDDNNTPDYELNMGYESGVLLSDLLLYDHLPENLWRHIISNLVETIHQNNQVKPSSEFYRGFEKNSNDMWLKKLTSRVDDNMNMYTDLLYKDGREHSEIERDEFDMNMYTKHIQNALNIVYNNIKNKIHLLRPVGLMHGDMHLGNVIYDYHIDKCTFIDPRGQYGNSQTVEGDNYYDLAKLGHDIIFGYNAMVAGYDQVSAKKITDDVMLIFQEEVLSRGYDWQLVLAGALSLIFSCIPLHYEDEERQIEFLRSIMVYV